MPSRFLQRETVYSDARSEPDCGAYAAPGRGPALSHAYGGGDADPTGAVEGDSSEDEAPVGRLDAGTLRGRDAVTARPPTPATRSGGGDAAAPRGHEGGSGTTEPRAHTEMGQASHDRSSMSFYLSRTKKFTDPLLTSGTLGRSSSVRERAQKFQANESLPFQFGTDYTLEHRERLGLAHSQSQKIVPIALERRATLNAFRDGRKSSPPRSSLFREHEKQSPTASSNRDSRRSSPPPPPSHRDSRKSSPPRSSLFRESQKPSPPSSYTNSRTSSPPPPASSYRQSRKSSPPSSSYRDSRTPSPPLTPTSFLFRDSQKPSQSLSSHRDSRKSSPPSSSYRDCRKSSPPSSSYRGSRKSSPTPSSYRDSRKSSPPPSSYRDSRTPSPPPSSYRDSRKSSPPPSSYSNSRTSSSSPPPPSSYRDNRTSSPPPSSYRESRKSSPPPSSSYRESRKSSPPPSSYRGSRKSSPPSSYRGSRKSSPTPSSYRDSRTPSPTPPSSYSNSRKSSPPPSSYRDNRTSSPPPSSSYRDSRKSSPPPSSYSNSRTSSPPPSSYSNSRKSSPPPSSYRDNRTSSPPPSTYRDNRTSSPPPSSSYRDNRKSSPPPSSYRDNRTSSPPSSSSYSNSRKSSPPPSTYRDNRTSSPPPSSSYRDSRKSSPPPPSSYSNSRTSSPPPPSSYSNSRKSSPPPSTYRDNRTSSPPRSSLKEDQKLSPQSSFRTTWKSSPPLPRGSRKPSPPPSGEAPTPPFLPGDRRSSPSRGAPVSETHRPEPLASDLSHTPRRGFKVRPATDEGQPTEARSRAGNRRPADTPPAGRPARAIAVEETRCVRPSELAVAHSTSGGGDAAPARPTRAVFHGFLGESVGNGAVAREAREARDASPTFTVDSLLSSSLLAAVRPAGSPSREAAAGEASPSRPVTRNSSLRGGRACGDRGADSPCRKRLEFSTALKRSASQYALRKEKEGEAAGAGPLRRPVSLHAIEKQSDGDSPFASGKPDARPGGGLGHGRAAGGGGGTSGFVVALADTAGSRDSRRSDRGAAATEPASARGGDAADATAPSRRSGRATIVPPVVVPPVGAPPADAPPASAPPDAAGSANFFRRKGGPRIVRTCRPKSWCSFLTETQMEKAKEAEAEEEQDAGEDAGPVSAPPQGSVPKRCIYLDAKAATRDETDDDVEGSDPGGSLPAAERDEGDARQPSDALEAERAWALVMNKDLDRTRTTHLSRRKAIYDRRKSAKWRQHAAQAAEPGDGTRGAGEIDSVARSGDTRRGGVRRRESPPPPVSRGSR